MIFKGTTTGDFSQVAVGTVIFPNVIIGKYCLIGAQSLGGKDVDDYQLIAENSAKLSKDVRELKSKKTGNSHYPWPKNFHRGMPSESIEFKK